MQNFFRLAGTTLPLIVVTTLFAQPAPMSDPPANPTPPVAATVNGQPIYEFAVERAVRAFPADQQKAARQEIIDTMIETAIIDQYLAILKITVEPKEVDQKVEDFKEDLKKHQLEYAQYLKQMRLTETELKVQIHNQLRWEKFVAQQATEEKLKALFNQAPEGFDGTEIRARHILIDVGSDPKSKQDATAKLLAIKDQIQKTVAAGMAKLPPDVDNVTKGKQRQMLIEEAFGDAARAHSSCVSKDEGGDLRWFPRYGKIIEPLAKAAFALKPYEMSDVIVTPAGCDLLLLVGRKGGLPVKYEDPIIKEHVKLVYEMKLKEAVLDQMRPRAKIEIIAR